MAVYGYCRVSTDRQADEGESLGAQERVIKGYCIMHGMAVDRAFIERGVSGSKPLVQRPEGSRLLDSLAPGDVIVTAKLDRMFRSALDALNVLQSLKDRGVSLHMIDLGGDVTGNGISKLVFTILSAVAEAERDRIRERVRDTKADQRNRQRYLGGTVPFGYLVNDLGDLVPDTGHQRNIIRIRELRAAGKSFRAISAQLAAEGVKLTHMGVKKVIERHGSDEMQVPISGDTIPA